jgi:REP element-mobilizing transposase RayT
MPRKSRIDAPGALHHIIARGIDRKTIFRDDSDRDNFLERLGNILSETQTACFAWTLIPNHFHLLLRTGTTVISTVMRRLLTGYAVSYNFRHRRHGHLFQNRYKSILCQVADPPLEERLILIGIGWIYSSKSVKSRHCK